MSAPRRPITVVGPSIHDPRLWIASVVITLQVLGQTLLHFDVSIAQILVAILTCALIEVAVTFVRRARADLARERHAHGERHRLRAAGAGNPARRLVEHAGRVDLRRHRRDRDAVEVPHTRARLAHLQPVEHRARDRVPRARTEARGTARLLVGPGVVRSGAGAGCDRRRRGVDPLAAAHAARGACVPRAVRGGARGGRRARSLHDRALARRSLCAARPSGGCSSPHPRCSCSRAS